MWGGGRKKGEGGPQRKIDQKPRQIKRKSVCDSFTAWPRANSHWPCFDSESLNDMCEASSCPLLRKHMIRCPYLIHDKSDLPGLERAQHITAVRAKRTNGQRGRHSADPGTQTEKPPPLKSHVQSYFIQKLTAITVASHRQSECVIYSIFLKADSLTIVEHSLLFCQPKSCHWGSVWVFLPVKPVSTHTRTHTHTLRPFSSPFFVPTRVSGSSIPLVSALMKHTFLSRKPFSFASSNNLAS